MKKLILQNDYNIKTFLICLNLTNIRYLLKNQEISMQKELIILLNYRLRNQRLNISKLSSFGPLGNKTCSIIFFNNCFIL